MNEEIPKFKFQIPDDSESKAEDETENSEAGKDELILIEEVFAEDDEEGSTYQPLFEAPVVKPVRVPSAARLRVQEQVEDDAERALTGKRPSFREPRKTKNSESSSDIMRLTQQAEEEFDLKVILPSEKNVKNKRFPKLEIKEDIEVTIGHAELQDLIINSLNEQFYHEGLEVSEDGLDLQHKQKMDEEGWGTNDIIITVKAKMKRIKRSR